MGDELSYKRMAAAFVAGGIDGAIARLEAQICARLAAAERPGAEVLRIIEELRGLGHDLWSFDEDDGFQIWLGNYAVGAIRNEYNLVIEFNYPADGEPSVEASFGPWPK